ncbi:acetate--CoA ligase family protein [Desulfovirgula thermocuniculi]|uniref:acetate--CoA ligase family protein n=1 Tax=Desulfovirgula thermocuniculi TaxID=348842 RepID=UPI000427939E|nr:CoA-binding protein [Desulfovirgula thermocuniculi]
MGQKAEVIARLFYPRAVAVIGVTASPERVGYNLLESIVSAGFKGRIYPVHPRLETLAGLPVYRSLEEVPGPVDLAVVGVNQLAALEVVEECGRKGVKGVVLVAGGFKETGPQGEALEKRLVEVARRYGMEVVGPNTLGLLNTHAGLNATFYPLGELPRGSASFITQSGGVGLAILQKARDEGLGIGKWVGVGNRSTLEPADYLEYLAQDESTSVIGLFLEGTEDAGRLARVAGKVARQKPVVVYKVGRSGRADFAALTHTGSMAGSYRMYRQIFGEQFGLLMVENTLAMVAACKALALAPRPAGNGVGVVTHTAGPSIVFLDEVAMGGGVFPAFAPETMEKIKGILGENPPVVLKNPLDAAGQGMQAATFGRLLEAVAQDPGVNLLAAIFCQHRHWRCPTPEILAVRERYGKPVVALYIAALDEVRPERDILQGRGVPVYLTPEEASWGATALIHYALRRGEGE